MIHLNDTLNKLNEFYICVRVYVCAFSVISLAHLMQAYIGGDSSEELNEMIEAESGQNLCVCLTLPVWAKVSGRKEVLLLRGDSSGDTCGRSDRLLSAEEELNFQQGLK